jgi:hypothetical protein
MEVGRTASVKLVVPDEYHDDLARIKDSGWLTRPSVS